MWATLVTKRLLSGLHQYDEVHIEETGWKLVHGDVFRPPFNNRLFAAVIGSGIQIFTMLAITIFFAMLGMLSPASRGALLTAAIFLPGQSVSRTLQLEYLYTLDPGVLSSHRSSTSPTLPSRLWTRLRMTLH